MDLLTLKALADETRFELYRELGASPAPRTAQELADRLGLHPNTVRLHLERLREAGVVAVEARHRGTVGRPQHRYALAPGAPGLGFDPPAHVLLAGLLASLAETIGADPDDATAVGRAWGARAAQRAPMGPCLTALRLELERLGFEPATTGDEVETARIDFLHCPFRELAEAYPDLVCNLHRGICEGMVSDRPAGRIASFATLYDHDPCHVCVMAEVS